MMISGALGMLVFVTYPVAPPRLADLGLVDTVTQSSDAYRYLQPPAFVNQYAAMPSLHAGWDLLVGIAIFTAPRRTSLLKVVGCVMPLLMAGAVIATANHFVVDVSRASPWCWSGTPSRSPRAAAPADGAGQPHDRAGHRPPGRQLAGGAARGERRSASTSSSATSTSTAAAGGPAPQDRRAAALPVGPVGAGPRLRAAPRAARAARGRPARHDVHARPQGSADHDRPAVARLLHDVGRHRPVLVCGRYWPVRRPRRASSPFVARCSPPATGSSWPGCASGVAAAPRSTGSRST